MLWGAGKALLTGNFKGIVAGITKPWKTIWQQVKDLFSGRAYNEGAAEAEYDNPTDSSADIAHETSISVRSLGLKGNGKAESNLAYFNRYQSMFASKTAGDLGERIKGMDKLY